jgi:hypothetical protein
MKMDVAFFKPFVDGTLNTLKVQCGTEAKPGKPFIKNGAPKLNIEIADYWSREWDIFRNNCPLLHQGNVPRFDE